MSRISIAAIFIIVILLALGGFVLVNKYPVKKTETQNKEKNLPIIVQPEPVISIAKVAYSISGTVRLVSPTQVSFSLSVSDARVALINFKTKIIKVLPKDTQVAKKEIEEFIKFKQNLKNENTNPPVISQPQEEGASFSDIKVGDTIVVTTENDPEKLKEFIAKEIKIMPR